jgi:hypothetical protein
MRHPFRTLVRLALVLADRAPQRALNGTTPIVGSLDTWPAVPRNPGAPAKV